MSASLLAVDHGRRPRFGLVLPLLAAAALLAACQREVEKPAPEIRPVRTITIEKRAADKARAATLKEAEAAIVKHGGSGALTPELQQAFKAMLFGQRDG